MIHRIRSHYAALRHLGYRHPIDLRYIKAGANRTTGHPYYILGFDYV